MFGLGHSLDHVLSFSATIGPPEVIGPVAEGLRFNVYVASGEVSGPRVRGKLRPVGGDWVTVRTDGVVVLDVRVTIETDDGALIQVAYPGILDLGPDGHQSMLRGEPVPDGSLIRVAPRLQTAHPEYQWLNRLFCVGLGETHLSRGEVRYDVYAVR